MQIAAIQMVSTPDLGSNLARAAVLVGQAAAAGAELVALPEYFCLMGRRDTDKLALAEPEGTGPIQQAMATLAREHRLWLVAGTQPLAIAGDEAHATNTCLVFGPDGERVARYDKIHLFRYDDGQRRYDEAATLAAGHEPVAFEARPRAGARTGTDASANAGADAGAGSVAAAGDGAAAPLRVGLSVCYDLRFPELYRRLMQPPCALLVVPAAFTYPTGQAHWELLLRARAVENQCYVLASAQGGQHENGRRTWGHSMVIDPWGRVLACQPEGEGVVSARHDPTVLAEVRSQLPALEHRRL